MNRYTTKFFVERAEVVYGDRYTYENVLYTGTYDKVSITCKIHGDFLQTPKKHLRGQGCPKCGLLDKKKTNKTFIERAALKHGDLYDYSGIVGNPKTKEYVDITCKIHGSFHQMVKNHLSGYGCPTCGIDKNSTSRVKTTEQFIKDVNEVHGGLYDYSKTVYSGTYNDVTIICSVHGKFIQKPSDHLSGCGCPRCHKSGYKSNLKGYIYIHKVSNGVYKLGITNFPDNK